MLKYLILKNKMKKIGLITTNRLLAQSLNMALGVLPNLELELIQLQKIEQALIDGSFAD